MAGCCHRNFALSGETAAPDEGSCTAAKDRRWFRRERRQQRVGIVAVPLHAHVCLGVIERAAAEPSAVVGHHGILISEVVSDPG